MKVGVGDVIEFSAIFGIDKETDKKTKLRVNKGRVRGWKFEKVKGQYKGIPHGKISHLIVSVPAFGKGTWEKHYDGDPVRDWNSHVGSIPDKSVLIPFDTVIKNYGSF